MMKMNDEALSLDVIDVAAPCPALWEDMQGTDRVRFCGDCKLNVYNLSGMSTNDAEQLMRQHEGRLCIRFYRRADGTILTKDCPIGLRALRRKLARSLAAVAALAVLLTSGTILAGLRGGQPLNRRAASSGGVSRFINWLHPDPPVGTVTAGEMCVRPIPTAPVPPANPPAEAPQKTPN